MNTNNKNHKNEHEKYKRNVRYAQKIRQQINDENNLDKEVEIVVSWLLKYTFLFRNKHDICSVKAA